MNHQSRGFVYKQDVLVLVDHADLRGNFAEVIHTAYRLLCEKLLTQIKADNVTLFKYRVGLGFRAVELYAFFSHKLADERRFKIRIRLSEKTVCALSRIVFLYGDLCHFILIFSGNVCAPVSEARGSFFISARVSFLEYDM